MKYAEVRKLVGKTVQWEVTLCRYRGTFRVQRGIILEIKGRNVRIDRQGCDDWFWIPDLKELKEVKP